MIRTIMLIALMFIAGTVPLHGQDSAAADTVPPPQAQRTTAEDSTVLSLSADSGALVPDSGTIAQASARALDSLRTELRIRALRDSLSSTRYFAFSPTGGVQVRGYNPWLVLLFGLAAFGLALYSMTQVQQSLLLLGLAFLLVAGAAFVAGAWTTRRGIAQEMPAVERTVERATADSLSRDTAIRPAAALAPVETEPRPSEAGAAAPSDRLLTRGMVWAMILGAFLLLAGVLASRLQAAPGKEIREQLEKIRAEQRKMDMSQQEMAQQMEVWQREIQFRLERLALPASTWGESRAKSGGE